MFILVNSDTIGAEVILDIVDTDDLICESISKTDLVGLYQSIPNLVIKGVEYDANCSSIKYRKNPYGTKYERISDDFGAIIKRKKVSEIQIYYDVFILRKGEPSSVYHYTTPVKDYDYLDFCFYDLGNEYIAFTVNAVDKHFYAEDREEYFSLIVILDVRGTKVKEVRKDDDYVKLNNLKFYTYRDGVLHPFGAI